MQQVKHHNCCAELIANLVSRGDILNRFSVVKRAAVLELRFTTLNEF